MSSKSKKLVKGSLLGGVNFILRIFISLFMTPFMIAHFGDHTYGLWMLVASLSGFYGVLDLGLSTAVQRYMSRAIGQNDQEEVNNVFNTSLLVFCIIGVLATLFAGAVIMAAPFLVRQSADVGLFRLIIFLCSINVILGFPMRSFWGIFASNLRYDISVYLEIVNVILKTILIVLFLKFGFGIIAVSLINLAIDLLWNISNIIYALKVAPYIRFSMRYIKREKIQTFFGYSIYVFISRLAEIIKFNIDNYVISAFISLSAVTVYSIGTRLISYAMQFLLKITGLFTPVFSQYEGQGNHDAIKEKFLFVFKIMIYISIFMGSLLILLSRPFIQVWVGQGYEEAFTIVMIFIVPTVFNLIMFSSDQLLYGTSRHQILTFINTGEAVTNLILSLILVQFWGMKGVALGTAIPMMISKGFIQPAYTAKVLGINPIRFYGKMLLHISKALCVIVLLTLLTHKIIDASLIHLIIFGIIQSTFYAMIIFSIGFSRSEKDQFIKVFRKDDNG